MAPSFSDADDEILVEEVTNHPSLWQLSDASYKNQRVKDTIWSEIANKVGKPSDQCKKRWRNIKDTYDRKKNKKTGLAATPTKKGKKWALEEKLSFLRTAEEHRGIFSNLNPSQKEEVDSPLPGDEHISLPQNSTTTPTVLPIPSPCHTSPQIPQYPTTTRRRKRSNNRDKTTADNLEKREAERKKIMRAWLVEETEDDVDLFFKSLAKSVKKLTPVLQQRAKAETLNVITRLETEMWKPVRYGSFNLSNSLHFSSDTSASVSPQSKSSYSDTDSLRVLP